MISNETYHDHELKCEHTRLQRILASLQKVSVEISQSSIFFLTSEENMRLTLLQKRVLEAKTSLDKHVL